MRISDWSADVGSSDLVTLTLTRPLYRASGESRQQADFQAAARRLLRSTISVARCSARSNRSNIPSISLSVLIIGGTKASVSPISQNGRASFRERVWQYVLISVVNVSLKKKK